MADDKHRILVTRDDNGLRLDQVLAKHVAGLSRRRARVALDIGAVFVDKARVKVASRMLRPGQVIEITLGGALERATGDVGQAARARDAEGLPPHELVFVDEHLVVVHKPAGLVTAPTPESDRGNLLDILCRSDLGKVYLVHRLDRPTSGLLVFARTAEANKLLGDAFVAHAIERSYRAVVVGQFPAACTRIEAPVGGRPAISNFEIRRAWPTMTELAVRLETGRTHQIRLHAAGVGHPVLGDWQHGGELSRTFRPKPPRMMLHAEVLGLTHPITGEPLRFEQPPPEEFGVWVDAHGAQAALPLDVVATDEP